MRHKLSGRKLNRTSSHRKAMLANMAVALVTHEQIKTTLPKAKELRSYVEKLVTIARKNDLFSRRRIISSLRDKHAAEKLMAVLGPRYKERAGGYTRIVKAGFRYGDMAPVAYIEFVERDVDAKGKDITETMKPVVKSTAKKNSKKLDKDSDTKLVEEVKASEAVKEEKKPAKKAVAKAQSETKKTTAKKETAKKDK